MERHYSQNVDYFSLYAKFENFPLDSLFARYLAGGSALKSSRQVSRRRLFLREIAPEYVDPESANLQSDVNNYLEVSSYFRSINTPITVHDLCCAHEIFGNIPKNGIIRTTQNWVGAKDNPKYIPPQPDKVVPLLESMLNRINSEPNSWSKSVFTYMEFQKIHPFSDGNGRIARALSSAVGGDDISSTFNLSLYRVFNQSNDYQKMVKSHLENNNQELVSAQYWKDCKKWLINLKDKVEDILRAVLLGVSKQYDAIAMNEESSLLDFFWCKPVVMPEYLEKNFNFLGLEVFIKKLIEFGVLEIQRCNYGSGYVLIHTKLLDMWEKIDLLLSPNNN